MNTTLYRQKLKTGTSIMGGPTVFLMTDATPNRVNIELHLVWFYMCCGQCKERKENEKGYQFKTNVYVSR